VYLAGSAVSFEIGIYCFVLHYFVEGSYVNICFFVSDESPPVPVSELLGLVDFSLVRWDLITQILPTWIGMVFVVSFASCLDVVS
jgi:hypothetical protein